MLVLDPCISCKVSGVQIESSENSWNAHLKLLWKFELNYMKTVKGNLRLHEFGLQGEIQETLSSRLCFDQLVDLE